MKTWTRPIVYAESFELDQHYAAACVHPVTYEKLSVLGCMHKEHQAGTAGHTWDVSKYSPFTSQISACVTKWDTREQIVNWAKYPSDPEIKEYLGNDINSWGSQQHGPMLNGHSVETLFNSF